MRNSWPHYFTKGDVLMITIRYSYYQKIALFIAGITLYIGMPSVIQAQVPPSDAVIYYENANFGIGLQQPKHRLEIKSYSATQDTTIGLQPPQTWAGGFLGRYQHEYLTASAQFNHTYFANNAYHDPGKDQYTFVIGNSWVHGQVIDLSLEGFRFRYFDAVEGGPNYQTISQPRELFTIDRLGRVGIGVTSPVQRLEVNGKAAIMGNVGIGTAPTTGNTLHVATGVGHDATLKLSPNGSQVGGYFGRFQKGGSTASYQFFYTYIGQNARHVHGQDFNTYLVEDPYVDGQVLDFSTHGMRFLYLDANYAGPFNQTISTPKELLNIAKDGMVRIRGKAGVGPVTPNATLLELQPRLWVDGLILAKEVVVTSNWADYVFEEDYQLMPLPEVKKFIKTHKHLPGVPSEKEIRKNGVKLGETQTTLLAKIEELTLYVLQQNDAITELKTMMTAQQQAIADLQRENRELKAVLRSPSKSPAFSLYSQEKPVTALQRTSY